MSAAHDPELASLGLRQSHFVEALQQSDLRLAERLLLRTAYLRPANRTRIDEYITALATDAGSDISTMANGDIIKFIIEHLDEIAVFIKVLIGLFS
jgi:hypothetical protein